MARILVVAEGSDGADATAKFLSRAGHTVAVAAGFKHAVELLTAGVPDLLISEIRLGEFNGLHLAIRIQVGNPTVRTILLDHMYDPLTEAEAKHYGTRYLVEPDEEALLAQVSDALASSNPSRRWPRKKVVDGMLAEVERRSGRVVDLSYGGLRFELPEITEVPTHFDVALPGPGLVFQAKPVWTRRVAPGWLSFGVELLDPTAQTIDSWRRFVDAVPDAS